MTYADVKALEIALEGTLTRDQERLALQLLASAEQMISDRVPSLQNLCAADELFAQTVAQVAVQAVARVLRGSGEDRGTLPLDGRSAAEALYLTGEENARLSRNTGLSGRDAFFYPAVGARHSLLAA